MDAGQGKGHRVPLPPSRIKLPNAQLVSNDISYISALGGMTKRMLVAVRKHHRQSYSQYKIGMLLFCLDCDEGSAGWSWQFRAKGKFRSSIGIAIITRRIPWNWMIVS
jgi:hypothetical protein